MMVRVFNLINTTVKVSPVLSTLCPSLCTKVRFLSALKAGPCFSTTCREKSSMHDRREGATKCTLGRKGRMRERWVVENVR